MSRFRSFFKNLKSIDKLVYLYGKTIEFAIPGRYKQIVHFRSFINNTQSLGYEIKFQSDQVLVQSGFYAIKLRDNTSDKDAFSQIFINNEYQTLIDYIHLNEIEINTIVDAGANIGLSAIKFSNAFPNCKIICLEPDSDNFEQLQINLENISNVIMLQKALWHKQDFLTLNKDFRDSREWSRRVVKSNNTDDNFISAVSIADIIKQYSLQEIDFLKIDIEGSEAEIFKAENDLSFLRQVKIIAIEIHDEFNCRNQIYRILRDNSFFIFNTGELTIGVKHSNK
ncbi:hypothetical protein ASE92_19260 [Pedobacter sp. Leaf41]|uniref:FkbM family methyltransferase n=1 Tax=Pedobacter sp. Leaf41 TaxID=1736218 RepID=UPI0007027B9A|nr:FkbM family methyltransferase [Pedobacter sp. Leaf41]KQN30878.1 hypothetical protein ASE92_19260 [Pedobacter sp. Leaf41]